ncbi:MAG: dihydroorotase [Patescibacteria group bacterium]
MAMGNLKRWQENDIAAQYYGQDPGVRTGEEVVEYGQRIIRARRNIFFKPQMTLKADDGTTPQEIHEARQLGIMIVKTYPVGVTTNSHAGVSNFRKLGDVFAAMEEEGMVWCHHGEKPGEFCLEREPRYMDTLEWAATKFPRLRMVLEHVSTAIGVRTVCALPDTVAATVTVQHLLRTLDDVLGGELDPHAFCKPLLQTPQDREAIQEVVRHGNQKFFLGTDSAPHKKITKECGRGKPGSFTAPVAPSLLLDFFESFGHIERVEPFVSLFSMQFYSISPSGRVVTFVKKPWVVPDEYNGIVPFMAGKTLQWQIAD